MTQLGRIRANEFAARGNVVEQVPYFDHGPAGMRGRAQRRYHATLRHHFHGVLGLAGTGDKPESRNGGNGWQRLAAKTQRDHGLEIIERRDLACRMAREGECKLVRRDTASVVAHSHEPETSPLDVYFDTGRLSIETVLCQFLDHRRGSFDHLARSNLVDKRFWENTDGHGAISPTLQKTAVDYKTTSRRARRAERLYG